MWLCASSLSVVLLHLLACTISFTHHGPQKCKLIISLFFSQTPTDFYAEIVTLAVSLIGHCRLPHILTVIRLQKPPMYAYLLNIIRIGIFFHPWKENPPKFYHIFIFIFSCMQKTKSSKIKHNLIHYS